MQPIKFRVWDIKYKKMYDNEDCDIEGLAIGANGLVCCDYIDSIYLNHEYREDHEFEIMLYIGLSDINMKDIYNDDIIIDSRFGKRKKIVYYHTDSAQYRYGHEGIHTQYDKSMGFLLNPFLQVIGNIHENPELIKE